MRESNLQSVVASETRALPRAVVLNKTGSHLEGRGWPDLFVWSPTWTGLLELKIDAPVSQEQWDRIRQLRDAGTDVRVMRLVSDFKSLAEVYQVGPDDVGPFVFVSEHQCYTKPEPRRGFERLQALAASREILGRDKSVPGYLT